jgi:hypothetical protein
MAVHTYLLVEASVFSYQALFSAWRAPLYFRRKRFLSFSKHLILFVLAGLVADSSNPSSGASSSSYDKETIFTSIQTFSSELTRNKLSTVFYIPALSRWEK